MLNKKWFWLVLIAIFWEVTPQNGLIPSYVFPPLSTIITRSYNLLRYEEFGNVILASLKTILHGFVISFSAAIVVASISVYCKSFGTLVMALHDILNPLPSVAILPIVLLICGLTKNSLYILIIHAVFWPLVATLMMSISTIPQEYRNFSYNIGISKWKMSIFVFIPAIFPYLLSGVRNSWGRAWRSLISAEAIFYISGSQQGIGYWIYSNRAYANMCDVMVGVFMIVLISISVEKMFQIIENHTIKKWGVTK